jgi:uncharacterized protein (TIGR02145 family)
MAAGTCTTTTTKSQLFTQGPILMDARDGKKYEIRKFPDGKCWMVDNLRYGGTTDACSGKTTFSGNGAAAASNRFGANTYGDCRDAKIGAPSGTPCYNTTACGYYYNWQAAMQASGAYYNVSYTTPSYPWQGICPDGWHLPRGGTDDSSEFITLDKAVGGTGANSQTGANYVHFWKVTINNVITSTDPWKGVLAGASINNSGGLIDQSLYGNWWSSTESSATNTYCLYIYSSNMHPQYNVNNNDGRSLRCIKD